MPQPQLTPEDRETLIEKLQSVADFLRAVPVPPELNDAVLRELAEVKDCLAILGKQP